MDEQVQCVIAHEMTGDFEPYASRDLSAVGLYIEMIRQQLASTQNLAPLDVISYPKAKSVSFNKVLCPKADGGSTYTLDEGEVVAGIAIYICLYAPIAIWGCGTRTTLPSGQFDIECSLDLVYTPPKLGSWTEEMSTIDSFLRSEGLELPARDVLGRPLSGNFRRSSALAVSETPTIYDGLFHLEY